MRVALFTPLSPVKTALADVIEGYLPYLACQVDLTAVTAGDYKPTAAVTCAENTPHISVISYQQFRASADTFDLIVYNLGDEPNIHGYMFDALREYPGVVLLHDLVLHHAIFQRTWAQGKVDEYIAELNYSYGPEITEHIIKGVRVGQFEALASQYPLVERILDSSLAVVGFNDYLVGRVHELAPDLLVKALPLPFYIPQVPDAAKAYELRHQLGGEGKTVFATFGLFNSQKRLKIALRAFQQLRAAHSDIVYALIGTALDKNIESQLADLNIANQVITTGWLPPEEFVQYMYAVDIAVQLRFPHVGGTPYTPIRLLGLGVPTIISDIEPQADIPEDAVIRIPPDRADEEARLYQAMETLLTHPEKREAMAKVSKEYIHTHHDTAATAKSFSEFLEQVYQQQPTLLAKASRRSRGGKSLLNPSSDLVYQAGKALAEMGVYSTDTGLLRAVAGAIDDLSQPEPT
ncbi:MAG: glycosyltransferase family 4 protein [Chloroflexi bacterium]|nr:glycosyltransferase family 4 protein [Chloroflexota bacterium]